MQHLKVSGCCTVFSENGWWSQFLFYALIGGNTSLSVCLSVCLHMSSNRGASVSPNPRLPSFRKFWAPIFPNCFLLKLQSLRIQLLGRLQFLRFLLFFKWPFLTSKCQNFEKSYKINLKDEIIVDQYPKVNTFKLFYIGVRLWIRQRLKNSESLEPWIIQ